MGSKGFAKADVKIDSAACVPSSKKSCPALASAIPPPPLPTLVDFLAIDQPATADKLRFAAFVPYDDAISLPSASTTFCKPPLPFNVITAMALLNSRQATLPTNEIFEFIRKNFPYFRTYRSWEASVKRALLAFPQWFSRYHPTHFQSNFHLWHFSSVEAVDIAIEKLSRTKELYQSSLHEFMAWPHLGTAIFRGVVESRMMPSLMPFLRQLGEVIDGKGVAGRHTEVQWWNANAPWLPKS